MWLLLVGVVACGGSSSKLPPTISLDPTGITVKVGASVDVTATYVDADGAVSAAGDATFSVAGSTVASVTAGANGHATIQGLAVGKTILTVTGQNAMATFPITVTDTDAPTLSSIEITPATPSIALGTKQQLTATGLFSDGSKKDITADVTWSSSAVAHATVAATGLVTSVGVGTTTITATQDKISATTDVTVTAATLVSIAVAPAATTLAAGHTQQLTATGTFTDGTTQDLTAEVTWASSTAAATVSNTAGSLGLATAITPGPATISATKGDVSGSATLTVTAAVLTAIAVAPATPTGAAGTKVQFTATGTFSDTSTADITTQVAWTSSDTSVATISTVTPIGQASLVAGGTTTITAALDGVSATQLLTVSSATLVSIAVSSATGSAAIGHTVAFKATGTFTDSSTQDLTAVVVWSTSDATIATVSNAVADAGVAKAIALGTATITATTNVQSGSKTDSATLMVTAAVLDSITVAPASTSVIPGGTQQFTATANNSDGTHPAITVTWASSVPATATIDASGLATGVAVGVTTISATFGTGATAVVGSTPFAVRGPGVVSSQPRDTAFGIRTTTPIVVTFDQAVKTTTVTVQAASGTCSGTLQLSTNNFTSCLGFTGGVTFDAASLVATAKPTAVLSAATTYKLRVTAGVTDPAGGAGVPFTQATGFLTSVAGTCASGLVISQVFGGGNNSGSPFSNDFIELHNGGPTPIDLTGFAVQFVSAAQSNWAVQPLPSVIVPAGGYFLIQESAGGTGSSPALPTPDFIPVASPGGFSMGAGSGKVALTSSTTVLTGTCPLDLTNDFVGYGTTANCVEGSGPTAAPASATAVLRNSGGCTDSNDNKLDFTVATPTPRNAATAASVCACFAGFDDDGQPAMSFLSAD